MKKDEVDDDKKSKEEVKFSIVMDVVFLSQEISLQNFLEISVGLLGHEG